ncbi:MAG: MarR family transcriptional regulator [Acaryochloris sp. RU_4_1]|nr:MarR family transcriptional regulator [Acaryochloris sp. RU_4_1]NJR55409.1 MarR family transcriptional regulator [Acaryochloris sp. CRU_2_0]
MNQDLQDYIAENWQALLDQASATLLESSRLKIPYRILKLLLQDGPLKLQEISDRLQIHPNTIATIARILEGKIFERSRGAARGAPTTISLHPYAIEQLANRKIKQTLAPPAKTKVIAKLPGKEFFRPLQSNTSDKWTFEDKDSPAFRIVSSDPNPWGQEWKILLSHQNERGDRSEWPYRLDLKLFPPDGEDCPHATFEREGIKGVFVWSLDSPTFFYAAPTKREKIWVVYSFYCR